MRSQKFFTAGNWKYILKTIAKNKLRSVLTALGIIIGVWAVIVLIAIGNGLKKYINDQFESLGSNSLYVMPYNEAQFQSGGGPPTGGSLITFDERDISKLERLENAQLVVPDITINNVVTYQKEKIFSEIHGTTESMKEAMNLEMEKGEFFNQAQEKRGKKVVVLGWEVADELFGEKNPIGQKVEISDKPLEVIGVVEKKGGGIGNGIDRQVYLPYRAAWKITGKKEFNFFLIKAKTKESIEDLKNDIKEELEKKYDEEDFSVIDQAEILSMINDILNIFTIALTSIAAISLIVGGVGIMNVMYVSVTERTREVGLRKAVGAANKDILYQFLAESITLSIIGGTVGLLLATLTAFVINKFFPASITLWSVFLALGVSSFVGIVFGITPARKASKLSPVEALRYE